MKTKSASFFISFVSFFVSLFLFVSSVFADAPEYYWPSTPRNPAKIKEISVLFDNVRLKNCQLNLNGLPLLLTSLAGYAVAPNDEHWNTTLIIPEQPAVRLGFAGFSPGDVIPSVTAPNMVGYIRGLTRRGATQILSTAQGTLSEDMVLLGETPQVVEYTLETTRCLEYFVEVQGRVLVFGYEAPEKIFADQRATARLVFARMSLGKSL